MLVRSVRTRVFKEGENLERFIVAHIPKIEDGAVLVVTSKIVALSEKRTVRVTERRTKESLIREESELAIPTKYAWLTVKDGTVMATAGIDESNANGKLILLPKDSFTAAARLRSLLITKYKVKRLGVLITDSRVLPLRSGVTGVALGYAGFKGLVDYRGKKDIFGRALKMTQVNAADALATAAVYLMGEGNEQCPLAVIEDAPVTFASRVRKNELRISIEDDLYRPLFDALPNKS